MTEEILTPEKQENGNTKAKYEPDQKPYYSRPFVEVGMIVLIGLWGFLCFAGGLSLGALQLFVTGFLSFLTLIVIAAQAEIYQRQARLMREGLDKTQSLIGQNTQIVEAMGIQASHMEGQLRAAERQANIATAQSAMTREQITLTKDEIETTKENLKLTEKMYYVSERAYIGIIGSPQLTGSIRPNEPMNFTFNLINGGRTPAFDVKCAVGSKSTDQSLATVKDEIKNNVVRGDQPFLLMSGQNEPVGARLPEILDGNGYDLWQADNLKYYVLITLSCIDMRTYSQSYSYWFQITRNGFILIEAPRSPSIEQKAK